MKNNIKIIPAALTESFAEISTLATAATKNQDVKIIQIDICDGKYVQNKTWPLSDKGFSEVPYDFEMPCWEDIDYEVDLMVDNPSDVISNTKNIGFTKAILHYKCGEEKILSALKLLTDLEVEIGIAVTNDDILESVIVFVKNNPEIKYLQVMGIEKVGVQGSEFDVRAYDTVKILREQFPSLPIQIDGSVSDTNIKNLYENGATQFVVGSWFKKNNLTIETGVRNLISLI